MPTTTRHRDYAAIAAEGRSRTRYIFRTPVFDDVLTLKQPLRAERRPAGPMPWGPWADEFRDRWNPNAAEPLRLTLASDALDASPAVCQQILGLAESTNLEVVVSPFVQGSLAPSVVPFSIEHKKGPYWGVRRTNREGEPLFSVDAEPELLTSLGKVVSEDGSMTSEQGKHLILELKAHEAFENDLFVTLNEYSLNRRTDRNQGIFGPRGIVTPEEALRLVGVLLRFRNDFRVSTDVNVDFTLFYSALTRGLLPTTMRAYRHCLSSNHRECLDTAANHLEGIIARIEYLLTGADQLAALAQREGRYSADNKLLAQQLYHLQNAVVLVTGALDMLAWFVAAIENVKPPRAEVDWKWLFGVKQAKGPEGARIWINDLREPMAVKIRNAAMGLPHDPVLAAAAMLRDSYQHRHPFRGAVCDFRDALQLPAVLASVVDLCSTLGPRRRFDAKKVPGLIEREEFQFLLPERFHRALIGAVIRNVENVLKAVEWDDEPWWLDQQATQVPVELIERLVVEFFGPVT